MIELFFFIISEYEWPEIDGTLKSLKRKTEKKKTKPMNINVFRDQCSKNYHT